MGWWEKVGRSYSIHYLISSPRLCPPARLTVWRDQVQLPGETGRQVSKRSSKQNPNPLFFSFFFFANQPCCSSHHPHPVHGAPRPVVRKTISGGLKWSAGADSPVSSHEAEKGGGSEGRGGGGRGRGKRCGADYVAVGSSRNNGIVWKIGA